MTYEDIFDEIKKKSFGSLYLFYGPEEYIKTQALSKMTAALISEDFKDLNYHIIDGSQIDGDELINSCETLPLMSEKRMIVVKDYPGLGSKKADNEDALKAYMERIPDTTCLVFYNRGNADKGRQLYKALKKFGKIVVFDRLKDAELTKWAGTMFKKNDKEIATSDLRYYLVLVGNNLEDVYNGIQKLVSYSGDSKIITRAAIESLITPSPEHTIFQLIDQLSIKESGKALLLLDELIGTGQHILGVITMIARHLKLMMLCKGYMDKGCSQKIVADLLKVPPFVARKCINQSQNFTFKQLKQAHDECIELDYGIKIGRVKDRLGLELFIIKMCMGSSD